MFYIDEPHGKGAEIRGRPLHLDPHHTFLRFSSRRYSVITIEGKFIGEVGPFDDPAVHDDTIVFRGTILVGA